MMKSVKVDFASWMLLSAAAHSLNVMYVLFFGKNVNSRIGQYLQVAEIETSHKQWQHVDVQEDMPMWH